MAGTQHNNMQDGLDAALPVYVPEEVLQANPKFKDTLNLLATRKIKPNGVSLTQHRKYEQVRNGRAYRCNTDLRKGKIAT